MLETKRLVLRRLTSDDAAFILELLNEPSFLRYIGDKGVRTLADAVEYIKNGPIASYERFGFGLYRVELKETAVPIGICGLLKRETLADVDVGFAFLPTYWSRGYAFEAASAVIQYGRRVLNLGRIVAITSPENDSSIRLLEKMGFSYERQLALSEGTPEVKLFALDF